MKRVHKARMSTDEDKRAVWFLWATNVLRDLAHIKRRIGFPPPEEIRHWVSIRQLVERRRKPRSKLRPNETALLIDFGDWLLEQRNVETTNAATMTSLLEAAAIFAHAHGDPQHAQVREIYDHIAEEFGAMPPPPQQLPPTDGCGWNFGKARDSVLARCEQLMRESDLVPDWIFYGRPIPPGEQPAEGAEPTAPKTAPKVGDLFEDGDER